jgi:MPBQ/MSBQ methyltransferase
MSAAIIPMSEKVKAAEAIPAGSHDNIIRYYEEAGPDYIEWSPKFNMHFGILKKGMNPFNREEMLDRMNHETLARLFEDGKEKDLLLDLGCGLGAPARYAAMHFPVKKVMGVTIVPWQVRQANKLTKETSLGTKVEVIEADYARLPFENNTADGAFAMESVCHSGGPGKEEFIREMHRVLKKGSPFVIADGFLKKPAAQFDLLTRSCYNAIRKSWALSDLAEIKLFMQNLKEQGFDNLKSDDVSWSVAPSVAHVPFVSMKFILKSLLRGKKLRQQNINNVRGSLLTMMLGLHRWAFGYYIVSGIKK